MPHPFQQKIEAEAQALFRETAQKQKNIDRKREVFALMPSAWQSLPGISMVVQDQHATMDVSLTLKTQNNVLKNVTLADAVTLLHEAVLSPIRAVRHGVRNYFRLISAADELPSVDYLSEWETDGGGVLFHQEGDARAGTQYSVCVFPECLPHVRVTMPLEADSIPQAMKFDEAWRYSRAGKPTEMLQQELTTGITSKQAKFVKYQRGPGEWDRCFVFSSLAEFEMCCIENGMQSNVSENTMSL